MPIATGFLNIPEEGVYVLAATKPLRMRAD